jgi:hypothetical protein
MESSFGTKSMMLQSLTKNICKSVFCNMANSNSAFAQILFYVSNVQHNFQFSNACSQLYALLPFPPLGHFLPDLTFGHCVEQNRTMATFGQ